MKNLGIARAELCHKADPRANARPDRALSELALLSLSDLIAAQ
jgi:hypothetical protein